VLVASTRTVAPAIKERDREIAKLDAQLRRPRPERPNIDKLRDALNLRAAEWRKTLREEPKVARVRLRRLVGPLTLWDPEHTKAIVEWETSLTPAILEGLTSIQVGSSPTGFGTAGAARSAATRYPR
jgi:hypothetical protein